MFGEILTIVHARTHFPHSSPHFHGFVSAKKLAAVGSRVGVSVVLAKYFETTMFIVTKLDLIAP